MRCCFLSVGGGIPHSSGARSVGDVHLVVSRSGIWHRGVVDDVGAYDGTLFDRYPVDGAHARVYRGPVRWLRERICGRERKQYPLRDDRADHNGGAKRTGDNDAARDDGGETQLIVMFAVRITHFFLWIMFCYCKTIK